MLRVSTKGDDQHVAISEIPFIYSGDRRHLMIHPLVIHDGSLEWSSKRKACEGPLPQITDCRLAKSNPLARNEEHQRPVNTVAMHALGCRMPFLPRAGYDPNLVNLDMPLVRPSSNRGQSIK